LSCDRQNAAASSPRPRSRRRIDGGAFRGDLTAQGLLAPLGSLLEAAARMTARHEAGVEKAAALVTTVFLHGTAS
jgi:hypothetical protein